MLLLVTTLLINSFFATQRTNVQDKEGETRVLVAASGGQQKVSQIAGKQWRDLMLSDEAVRSPGSRKSEGGFLRCGGVALGAPFWAHISSLDLNRYRKSCWRPAWCGPVCAGHASARS